MVKGKKKALRTGRGVKARREFSFERWVNIYSDPYLGIYAGSLSDNRKQADMNGGPTCVACIRVLIRGREGDGLKPARGKK